MNARDLAVGVKVYHKAMVHFGQGEVIRIRQKDVFGYKVRDKYRVQWSGVAKANWCRASELRKTEDKERKQRLEQLIRERDARRGQKET